VLFDDDGKIYAVYGARTILIVELTPAAPHWSMAPIAF